MAVRFCAPAMSAPPLAAVLAPTSGVKNPLARRLDGKNRAKRHTTINRLRFINACSIRFVRCKRRPTRGLQNKMAVASHAIKALWLNVCELIQNNLSPPSQKNHNLLSRLPERVNGKQAGVSSGAKYRLDLVDAPYSSVEESGGFGVVLLILGKRCKPLLSRRTWSTMSFISC